MRPRGFRPRPCGSFPVRFALLLLGLTLILAPAFDGAVEAGPGNPGGQQLKALDLCSVPALVLAPLAVRPAVLTTPVICGRTLPDLSSTFRLSDPPPRSG